MTVTIRPFEAGDIENKVRTRKENYAKRVFHDNLIRKIAEEGSCVIVGRCADYILRGLPYATNIFIYAEEADKIKRAVEESGDPPDQVRKIMRAADKARANYYAYHTGRKWGEHVNCNLSLDSGYLELEDAVDLIITYTEKQIWRTSTLDDEQY